MTATDRRSVHAGTRVQTGHCLCGAVQYQVHGELRPVIYCHCNMCRRTSGHFVAASACARADLVIAPTTALAWYRSSARAQRGFCRACGSNLFWDAADADSISIMAGSLDAPQGLQAREHIFTAEAGVYYRIADGLPQHRAWPTPEPGANP